MSREQWGHGYWKGVEDATCGNVRSSLPVIAKWLVCNMCISNADKDYDRSLFPVKELIAFLACVGLDTKYAQKVYKYVQKNEPYGCYISGHPKAPWKEDYFVLPFDSKDAWQKEADSLRVRMGGVA